MQRKMIESDKIWFYHLFLCINIMVLVGLQVLKCDFQARKEGLLQALQSKCTKNDCCIKPDGFCVLIEMKSNLLLSAVPALNLIKERNPVALTAWQGHKVTVRKGIFYSNC